MSGNRANRIALVIVGTPGTRLLSEAGSIESRRRISIILIPYLLYIPNLLPPRRIFITLVPYLLYIPNLGILPRPTRSNPLTATLSTRAALIILLIIFIIISIVIAGILVEINNILKGKVLILDKWE